MKLEIPEIARTALASYPDLLFRWFPAGRVNHHEFKIGNLQGDPGDSLSINIRSGKWADFAAGIQGGDPVSLYAAIHGINQLEAAKRLADDMGQAPVASPAQQKPPARKPDEYVQIIPAPAISENAVRHPKHGKPSGLWDYRTADGGLIGWICRFDRPDGKKEILPYSYGTLGGKTGWHWKSFTAPRPLINLDRLANSSGTVLVVEGEKAATAAQFYFPQFAVTTWPGGSNAHTKADFSPLAGRKVMLWPDNDDAGFKAMQAIASALRGLGCSVKFVLPPSWAGEGWDIADAEPGFDALAHARTQLHDELGSYVREKPIDLPIPPDYEPPPPAPQQDERDYTYTPEPANVFDAAPFRCLGYDNDHFYYLANETNVVVGLTASQHTKSNLLSLADLDYWRMEFPKAKSRDFDTDAAVNALMRTSAQRKFFTMSKIRGRGAWWDDGRVVVHLGDRVIVNGTETLPNRVPGKFIYQSGPEMDADLSSPLPTREAIKFVELMEMLAWTSPLSAKLAAGWCVCAHIGGVLRWRPHIWVIGRKGSGKTYTMSNIIRPVLGDNCLFVQAGSSEAGIRQMLGLDALPVLFDEAEGEDTTAQQNIQRVLGLVRQSSSDTGGQIAKGHAWRAGATLHDPFQLCVFINQHIPGAAVRQIARDGAGIGQQQAQARFRGHFSRRSRLADGQLQIPFLCPRHRQRWCHT